MPEVQDFGDAKARIQREERGEVHPPLAERRGPVANERSHLRVIEQRENSPLHAELREFRSLGDVPFLMKPRTEGVHRADVGVDCDRTDAALSLRDDEVLQGRLRGHGCSIARERRLIILECDLIPQQRGGRHVPQISALF